MKLPTTHFNSNGELNMNNRRNNELTLALAAMTEATSVHHVFDDSLSERGAGTVRYVLEAGDRLFLAWHDEDTADMVVSPIELWDFDNLLDALGDPLAVLSFREIKGATLAKVAARTFAASALPVTKTH
ncbi:MAG: hypothetical protein WJ306_01510 [Ferrovum myxofaciens]|jgi:hypothetical protein